MADEIVQTVKIQVEGADEAAAELKKVGATGTQSFEEMQRAAEGSTAEVGKGLDQVSEKSGITGKQMRALGKVAKEFGASEASGAAIGLFKMAQAFGPVGLAIFAVAEAFSFLKGKMKEAEEQAKAVTQTMANIAKVNAETKLEDQAAFWGTSTEAMKKFANETGRVAEQLGKAATGVKQVFDVLTTKDTVKKALVTDFERAGIAVDNLTAGAKESAAAMQQMELRAAAIYDGLAPIARLEFKAALKDLGFTDEQIKNIEKGAAALKQLQLEQFASSFENWRPAIEAVGQALQSVGESIVGFFQKIPPAVDASIAQVTAAITAWVTTPVANAWQWIVDAWNAMLAKLGFGSGGAGATAEGTTGGSFAGGGLLGGRGSGTSDSNLIWASRGEHIMPARAVAQPGVLAFLEALRRSGGNLRNVLDGMGRFALGGLVAPTLSIPAFAGGGAMSNVTIQFPGLPEITGLRASSAVVDELRRAAAMAQVRSGGRKPSRYS